MDDLDNLNKRLDDEIKRGKQVQKGLQDNLTIGGNNTTMPEETSDTDSTPEQKASQNPTNSTDDTQTPGVVPDVASADAQNNDTTAAATDNDSAPELHGRTQQTEEQTDTDTGHTTGGMSTGETATTAGSTTPQQNPGAGSTSDRGSTPSANIDEAASTESTSGATSADSDIKQQDA